MLKIDIQKQLFGADGEMNLKVNLEIKKGEFIILSGKSGSGKTTLLRIISGLEESKGTIIVNNKIWQDNNLNLAIQKRNIGFVFQDYALFPNMSVLDNLLFVNDDKKLANKLLKMTEMLELKHRYPNQLSGGQQQRISICRAMMNKPKLLLMDEPLSALDNNMRIKLQDEILALHKEFSTTTIMVSHNPSDIYRLASKVIILENGEISSNTVQYNNSNVQAEILDIRNQNNNYIAIISINNQFFNINISKEKALNLVIGDNIDLDLVIL